MSSQIYLDSPNKVYVWETLDLRGYCTGFTRKLGSPTTLIMDRSVTYFFILHILLLFQNIPHYPQCNLANRGTSLEAVYRITRSFFCSKCREIRMYMWKKAK